MKEYNRVCPTCSKEFVAHKIDTKNCSEKCWRRGRYLKHREEEIRYARMYEKSHPELQKHKKEYFKTWLSKEENRKRFYAHIYRYSRENPLKTRARGFVQYNKEKIISILGASCRSCKKVPCEYHHIKYFSFKSGDSWKKKSKMVRKYLIPLCKECHENLHNEQ